MKLNILLLLAGIFISNYLLAQTPPPTPVPLDPVSGALLAGGGLYLAKKVYKKYKV